MKILYSWLKDFIDLDLTPEELAKKLTVLGMEVEEIKKTGADFDDIYAAKIVKINAHPNSEKLHLVDLETKDGAKRVVCGAQNIAEGQTVPLANVGSRLGKIYLKPAEIRGVVSEGMLCSADELGLAAERQKGIMILSSDIPVGTDVKTLYGKADAIFEVSLTPNRPDLMSHLGIARELSVLMNLPLKNKEWKQIKGEGQALKISLHTDDKGCPRYAGRIIRNVKNTESPDWMKERLLAMGVNPKNALVDITNYVLFEIGHPMHAFDLNHLEGGEINVRWAEENEKFLGLDEVERTLTSQNLVIADGKKAVALAGVIGGKGDSILPETKDVFLEGAYFYPPCINKTSKKFAVSTESSQRFERGVDIDTCVKSIEMATALILDICGGEPSEISDVYPQPYKPAAINFKPEDIEKIIGMDIDRGQLKDIFNRLGADFKAEGETWSFTPLSCRRDLNHKWDLAEEAARYIGLDNLAAGNTGVTHASLYFGENPKAVDLGEKFSEALAGLGFYECKNFDFVSLKDLANFGYSDKTAVEIKNPLADGMEFMRPMLLISLLKNIAFNQNFGRHDLSLFEYGKTFNLQKGFPLETFALSGVMCGKTPREKFFMTPQCHIGFYGLKGIVENTLKDFKNISFKPAKAAPAYMHPKICMDIMLDNKKIGFLGQVHPLTLKAYGIKQDVYAFEFDLKNLEKVFDAQQFKKAEDISPFPASKRDLSVVLDKNISFDAVREVLKQAAPETAYHLIDLYQGDNLPQGKKSITLSFDFISKEKTLTDAEVNKAVETVLEALKGKLGAQLR